jgi:hypothetical protein
MVLMLNKNNNKLYNIFIVNKNEIINDKNLNLNKDVKIIIIIITILMSYVV